MPHPTPRLLAAALLLDPLKTRGSITGREWLASVELGNEVVVGSMRTALSGFTVGVE